MRRPSRAAAVGALLVLAAAPGGAQPPAGGPPTPAVQDRLAAQNALFRRQFAADTAASDGESPVAARARQHAADVAYRAELAAIAPEGFPEQDRVSHDLLLDVLAQRLADYALKTYEMPLTQMDGVHLQLARLPGEVPLATVRLPVWGAYRTARAGTRTRSANRPRRI